MYPQQYPEAPSAPPSYSANIRFNQHEGRQSMPDYHTTSEERMADFQQLVGRYESEFFVF
jgi:hypothetical protein